jgi:uncharacterized protein with HEPN domain
LQDAVIRNLQTLAESSQRLSSKIKSSEQELPVQSQAVNRMATHLNPQG